MGATALVPTTAAADGLEPITARRGRGGGENTLCSLCLSSLATIFQIFPFHEQRDVILRRDIERATRDAGASGRRYPRRAAYSLPLMHM